MIKEELRNPYVSYSRLNTLSTCSLQHFLKYVVGIKETKSPNLFFGIAFHDGVEILHKEIYGTKEKIQVPDINYIQKVFSDSWTEQLLFNEIEFSPKQSADGFNSMGRKLIETYIEKGTRKNKWNPLFVPAIGTEIQFQIPIVNLETGEPITKDFELMGKIDLIAETDEYGLIIVDHKTSAKKFQDHQIKLGMQLTSYSYAVRYLIQYSDVLDLEKKQEDNVAYNVFLKYKVPEILLYSTSRIDSDMYRFYRYVDQAVALMNSKIAFPEEGVHCSWCDFPAQCQVFGTPMFDSIVEEAIIEKEEKAAKKQQRAEKGKE